MTCGTTGKKVTSYQCLSIISKLQDKGTYLSWKEEKMETINIKFDKEQLEEVVKKVIEELKKEKDNFYVLSDTGYSDLKPKEKWSVMYLEFNEVDDTSKKGKLYFGYFFNTLSKECASDFDFSEYGREQVEKLKNQGWKEEIVE